LDESVAINQKIETLRLSGGNGDALSTSFWSTNIMDGICDPPTTGREEPLIIIFLFLFHTTTTTTREWNSQRHLIHSQKRVLCDLSESSTRVPL